MAELFLMVQQLFESLEVLGTNSFFFTLSNAKQGESIVIGLAARATTKGPQVETMESTKSQIVVFN